MSRYSRVSCYSLKLRKERSLNYPVDQVSDSSQAIKAIRAYLEDRDCEHLIALMLDAQNGMIGLTTVAIGGLRSCGADCRDLFKAAIVARAHALILGHNHSSGDVMPSKEDIQFTKKAQEAGEILGIPIVDHIIVSSSYQNRTYSFLANHLL